MSISSSRAAWMKGTMYSICVGELNRYSGLPRLEIRIFWKFHGISLTFIGFQKSREESPIVSLICGQTLWKGTDVIIHEEDRTPLVRGHSLQPWFFVRCDYSSMMTSSNGTIFRVTGPLCGEFTGLRWIPHSKASGAELWCFLQPVNKRLSKQSWGWWFETLSRSLWRHRNAYPVFNGGLIKHPLKVMDE